jgi:GT2 family glycosyltransferase
VNPPAPLTVGIATRNRPAALVNCLRSLRLLGDLLAEAIVVDDGSDPPIEGQVSAELAADVQPPARFLRNERSLSLAAARNQFLRAASTPWVLNLDDDAFILSRQAVEAAIAVVEADPAVAAVAFAQANEQGEPWPLHMQPAPVDHPCYVPTFIGYGHLLRRDVVLGIGGFRERLGIYGEEKDLSLRLLDAGYRVVYLPDARVGHVADASGRDVRGYLHKTVRNSTLGALYNEPFPEMVAGAGVRLWRYFAMRRGWAVHDPGGFGRIVRGLAAELPQVLRERRPVRRATWAAWRRMTGSPPEPYTSPDAVPPAHPEAGA